MNRAKGEINTNTIIVGDLDTQFSAMNRSFRHKVSKDIMDLNYTLHQIHLTDIYRTIHSTVEYTFLSSAQGRFSRINQILSYKWSLGKFKKTEIISSILSDHNTRR